MIFVWLPTMRGAPEPQKWNDENGTVVGGIPLLEPLAEHRLPPEHEGKSIAELAAIYPPPTYRGDVKIFPPLQEIER